MSFAKAILPLCFCTCVFAQEMTVMRLESVVDEVTELRMRQAVLMQRNMACEEQLRTQNEAIKKHVAEKSGDSETPRQEKKCIEKDIEGVQERSEKLQAKNKELKSKTKESIQAKRDAEDALFALKKENDHLSKKLAEAEENLLLLKKRCVQEHKENICPDENPFPKLLMREEKQDVE